MSISKIYFSSVWIEREISEMYGIFFYFNKDSRKLLLNYSENFFPLKKNYFLKKKKHIRYNLCNKNIYNKNNSYLEL